MPVSLTVDEKAGFVRVNYTEPYTFDEWLAAAAEFRRTASVTFNKQIGLLVDRTQVRSPSALFLNNVVRHLAASPSTVKRRRVAIVVSSHDEVQGAWVQAMMYEEAGATAAVFTSSDEAAAWLQRR